MKGRTLRSTTIYQWVEGQSIPLIVGVTLAFYLCFTVVALALHGGNLLWFVWLGERYHDLDPNGRTGYDGQFIYYLARDGVAAIPHLDNPPYRLQRIFYPVVVSILSLRQAGFVPLVMLGTNLAAIVVGTHVLARWLQFWRLPFWYALTFPFYVGTFLAYSRSLTEPFAFALTALGMVAWFQEKHARAAVFLALALLTKETVLLFIAGLGIVVLLQKEWRKGGWLLAAGVPLFLWELYLYWVFGEIPLFAGPGLSGAPLLGILPHLTPEPGRISALLFVALPALGLLIWAVVRLRQHPVSPSLWMLALNALLIVFLPLPVYDHIMHAARNATGLVLAAIFCFPLFEQHLRQFLILYWLFPTLIWLVPVLRWAPWLSQI
jgi:hypothetical protein